MVQCPGVNISESGEKIAPSSKGIKGEESRKGDDLNHGGPRLDIRGPHVKYR